MLTLPWRIHQAALAKKARHVCDSFILRRRVFRARRTLEPQTHAVPKKDATPANLADVGGVAEARINTLPDLADTELAKLIL